MCVGEDETIDTDKSLPCWATRGSPRLPLIPFFNFLSPFMSVQEMKANPETEIWEEPEPVFSGDDVVLVKGKQKGVLLGPKVGKVEVAIPF